MYVVYIDILFLINLVMDMMIFYIVSMVLNKPISIMRLFIGSSIAALVYCVLIYLPILQSIPYLIYALFVPVLPIIYLYKPNYIKEFVKIYGICMGTAFIIGGATFSLWYISGYHTHIQGISIMSLIVIGLSVTIIIYLSFQKIRKRFILPLFEYDLKIKHRGKEICIKSILDTGNCLYTPAGHKPVIVVTYQTLKELFTPAQIARISRCKNDVLELLCEEDFSGAYIIPFNSVGCKLGILLGIEVEKVDIYNNHFEKSVDQCIIGISFNNIFHDKSYSALLHPDFVIN